MDPSTGRLAMTWGNTLDIPRLAIKQIDLIERITRLAFTLENHLLTITAKVAFTGPGTFEGQLPDPRYKACFGACAARWILGDRREVG
jgi:hypothetical protein